MAEDEIRDGIRYFNGIPDPTGEAAAGTMAGEGPGTRGSSDLPDPDSDWQSAAGSEFGEVDNPANPNNTKAPWDKTQWDRGKWGADLTGWENEGIALPYGNPGDKYEIRNPETGQVTIAEVKDVGPGASTGKGIDLLPGTASKLGFSTNNIGRVEFRPIGRTLPVSSETTSQTDDLEGKDITSASFWGLDTKEEAPAPPEEPPQKEKLTPIEAMKNKWPSTYGNMSDDDITRRISEFYPKISKEDVSTYAKSPYGFQALEHAQNEKNTPFDKFLDKNPEYLSMSQDDALHAMYQKFIKSDKLTFDAFKDKMLKEGAKPNWVLDTLKDLEKWTEKMSAREMWSLGAAGASLHAGEEQLKLVGAQQDLEHMFDYLAPGQDKSALLQQWLALPPDQRRANLDLQVGEAMRRGPALFGNPQGDPRSKTKFLSALETIGKEKEILKDVDWIHQVVKETDEGTRGQLTNNQRLVADALGQMPVWVVLAMYPGFRELGIYSSLYDGNVQAIKAQNPSMGAKEVNDRALAATDMQMPLQELLSLMFRYGGGKVTASITNTVLKKAANVGLTTVTGATTMGATQVIQNVAAKQDITYGLQGALVGGAVMGGTGSLVSEAGHLSFDALQKWLKTTPQGKIVSGYAPKIVYADPTESKNIVDGSPDAKVEKSISERAADIVKSAIDSAEPGVRSALESAKKTHHDPDDELNRLLNERINSALAKGQPDEAKQHLLDVFANTESKKQLLIGKNLQEIIDILGKPFPDTANDARLKAIQDYLYARNPEDIVANIREDSSASQGNVGRGDQSALLGGLSQEQRAYEIGVAESAYAYLRGDAAAGGGAPQGRTVLGWAGNAGKLIDPTVLWPQGLQPVVVNNGAEHGVFRHPIFPNKVIKFLGGGRDPAFAVGDNKTFADYFERLRLYQQAFPELGIRFNGVIDGKYDPRNGRLSGKGSVAMIVTEMNFVNGVEPTEQEIYDWLSARGWIRSNRGYTGWFNPSLGLQIGDAHEGNFLKMPNGELAPIDVGLRDIRKGREHIRYMGDFQPRYFGLPDDYQQEWMDFEPTKSKLQKAQVQGPAPVRGPPEKNILTKFAERGVPGADLSTELGKLTNSQLAEAHQKYLDRGDQEAADILADEIAKRLRGQPRQAPPPPAPRPQPGLFSDMAMAGVPEAEFSKELGNVRTERLRQAHADYMQKADVAGASKVGRELVRRAAAQPQAPPLSANDPLKLHAVGTKELRDLRDDMMDEFRRLGPTVAKPENAARRAQIARQVENINRELRRRRQAGQAGAMANIAGDFLKVVQEHLAREKAELAAIAKAFKVDVAGKALQRGFAREFNPAALGEGAQAAIAYIIKERAAAQARTAGFANNIFRQMKVIDFLRGGEDANKREDYMAKYSRATKEEMLMKAEEGKPTGDPVFDMLVKIDKQIYKGLADLDDRMGIVYDRRDNYIKHMLEPTDRDRFEQYIDHKFKFADPRFMKPREFDSYREALAARGPDGKPLFKMRWPSRERLLQSRIADSFKAYAKIRAMKQLASDGWAFPLQIKERDSAGNWVLKNNPDPKSSLVQSWNQDAKIHTADGINYLVDPGARQAINNAYDKSILDGSPYGSMVQFLKVLKGISSPIHLGTTLGHEDHLIRVRMSDRFVNLARNPKAKASDWLFAFADAGTQPFPGVAGMVGDNLKYGGIVDILAGRRGARTPEEAWQVKQLTDAGFNAQPSFEREVEWNQWLSDQMPSWFRDEPAFRNSIGVAFKLLSNQYLNRWMFRKVIPSMKAASLMEKINNLYADSPELNEPGRERERLQELQKLGMQVDIREGEMNYDNLFWKKVHKDLGIALFQSLTWQLGLVDYATGGARDLTHNLTHMDQILATYKAKGFGPAARKMVTDKMLYGAFMTATTMIRGAIMTYIAAAFLPEDQKKKFSLQWLDYFYPRTSGVNNDGTIKRLKPLDFPTEIQAWNQHMREEGFVGGNMTFWTNKANPVLSAGYQAFVSKLSYYGQKISADNNIGWDNLAYFLQNGFGSIALSKEGGITPNLGMAGYAVKPVQDVFAGRDPTKDLLPPVLGFLGLNEAPHWTERTQIENDIIARHAQMVGSSRQETATEYNMVHGFQEAIRSQDTGAVADMYQQLLKMGKTPKQIDNIAKSANIPVAIKFFKTLKPADQADLWRKMNDEEKATYTPLLRKEAVALLSDQKQ